MAPMIDYQQSNNLKYFCKICKKGFACGRALGGHMRTHGNGDESSEMEDDDDDNDEASGWEDGGGKLGRGGGGANIVPSNRHMYALRTNPNRFKSVVRVCENCGEEFLCWKSFLEHGKCSFEDPVDKPFVSLSGSGSDGDDILGRTGCGGWSKRKRSFRAEVESFNNNNKNNPNCSSSNEEEEVANCLLMLSNTTMDPLDESSTSLSKDKERENLKLSFMAPVSSSQVASSDHNNKAKEVGNNNNNNKGLYECKACKRVFNSHQALGGHRASHKKVKGCFAARLDNLDNSGTGANDNSSALHFDHGSNNNNASSSKRKSRIHECSICHRVFSSGQALGGHKRCHWITSNAPNTSTVAKFQQFRDHIEQNMNNNPGIPNNKFADSDPIHLKLDLNLPAPSHNVASEIYLQPWVGGGGGGGGLVKQQKYDNNSQSHHHRQGLDNDNNENLKITNVSTMQNVEDDEADRMLKLAKLSELKDMNVGGSSSPWLQVGIGSTATTDGVGTDDP